MHMVSLKFNYGKNSVPQLFDTNIDTHAMQILSDYNPDLLVKAQPLDVENFAEQYLKLKFHYTNLSHSGFILGRMVFNNTLTVVYDPLNKRADEEPVDANTIVIDNGLLNDDKEVVFRSTVMHECGHAVYHDEYYCVDYSDMPTNCTNVELAHMPYTSCTSKDIVCGDALGDRKRLITDHDWIEHHAKYFSAAMLMPKQAIDSFCRAQKLQKYCFEQYPGRENDALVEIVAKQFNVSWSSALIRIKSLKLGFVMPAESKLRFSTCGKNRIPLNTNFD